MSSLSGLRTKEAAPWYRLVTELGNPNLTAVVIFCAIGLFATIAVILQYPGSWGDRRAVLIGRNPVRPRLTTGDFGFLKL